MESPWTGDIEDDVMRVWVKDSWQPPAFLIENVRACGCGSLGSQAQSRKSSPIFFPSRESKALRR